MIGNMAHLTPGQMSTCIDAAIGGSIGVLWKIHGDKVGGLCEDRSDEGGGNASEGNNMCGAESADVCNAEGRGNGTQTRVHTCGSGGLSFQEFKSAVRLLKTRTPIALLPDDFEILTKGGKLTDEEGEFSATQFQRMMRGEWKRHLLREGGTERERARESRCVFTNGF